MSRDKFTTLKVDARKQVLVADIDMNEIALCIVKHLYACQPPGNLSGAAFMRALDKTDPKFADRLKNTVEACVDYIMERFKDMKPLQ